MEKEEIPYCSGISGKAILHEKEGLVLAPAEMIPREIIIRNIEFKNPERIGMQFGAGRLRDVCSPLIEPSPDFNPGKRQENGFEYYHDEWGNLWHRVEGKSEKGEIFRPAIEDWKEFHNIRLPDLGEPARYERANILFNENPTLYRMGRVPALFSVCRYLRKMDAYLQDLILERKNIDELHERVAGIIEKSIIRWSEIGADGVFFTEDWGTQTGLLVSPRMWREIFKPVYSRIYGIARDKGLHVILHSCGYNREILEDLAETGVNCFQFDQPSIYGLEELSKLLKRLKVCLYSPVDIQKVLSTGNRKLISEHAKIMIELFGKPSGGFIAKSYGDLHGAGISVESDELAYRTFFDNMIIRYRV